MENRGRPFALRLCALATSAGARALDLAFPPVCLACSAAVLTPDGLCPSCWGQLIPIRAPSVPCWGCPLRPTWARERCRSRRLPTRRHLPGPARPSPIPIWRENWSRR
ncbi:double zinc ribbon domain-containing protein [Pelagibacterium nitratireducens]|uniref:Double zinc ribbon domain-containing protein n=1 Tax=Pelagibacterium nitratireducens TaxID=1046114 RepID=A0ABZ2IBD1_9HYPH